MSDKKYLQLDYATGDFFEYSGTEKEGFVPHTSKSGKQTFRKYYRGFQGVLDSVSVRDGNFGKQLSLAFEEGVYINFGLSDQKGNVDHMTEFIIKVLPALNKKDDVVLKGYNWTPEGEKYSKQGISVSINGEKTKGLTNAFYRNGELVEGDVPAVLWKENPLGGKKPSAASLEAKDDYLLAVLAKEAERLKWVGGGATTHVVNPQGTSFEGGPVTTTGKLGYHSEGSLPF